MNIQYPNPKLLLEFYKGQKIPPLVKKYDFETHFKEAHHKVQRRAQEKNNYDGNYVSGQVMAEVQKELEREVDENRELRLIIKELEQKLERLSQVNQELVVRIQQLQSRNVALSQNSENFKRDANRKVRAEIYHQIQEYLRLSVEKFAQTMKSVRMSPIIENKIQSFLEEILNINSLSVRKGLSTVNQSRNRQLFDQKQVDRTIKSIVERHSKSKQSQRKRQLERLKYDTILQRLNASGTEAKPGQIVTRSRSPNKRQTSGKKRTRIFNNRTNDSFENSQSKDPKRRLDF